ncbi:UNKNOWN [Stylonychia lemnae]|uniref:Uncharacterized protein n=1 Tax=Stylonychia lemnae TaxID=5949 RepID=A0A078AVM8_STYLE|nr:UNKNOWN [Stylonychia lemnae]|eukprot:CDW86126.1 UNKNOWN [Stylonychia lemnae]
MTSNYQQSDATCYKQSQRKSSPPSLQLLDTNLELQSDQLYTSAPLTPYLKPQSNKQNQRQLNGFKPLILPKSHNSFDSSSAPSTEMDTSTNSSDTIRSPTQQEGDNFVSWESILSALIPQDLTSFEGHNNRQQSEIEVMFTNSPIKSFLFARDIAQEQSQTSDLYNHNRQSGCSL